jgi:hypothetical protein
MNRIDKLKLTIQPEHIDVYISTLRTVEAIDKLGDEHRLLVAAQSLAGIKPNGEQEKIFYETLQCIRDLSIEVLEKEIEDWQHRGEKNYKGNFKN